MTGVAEKSSNRFNQADVCFALVMLTQQRGEGQNEAAKVHMAVHEGRLLKMSGERERERVVLAQAVFSLGGLAVLF